MIVVCCHLNSMCILCVFPQTKNASVLGFCWTTWNEIVFITDQGIEFYQVQHHSQSIKRESIIKSECVWAMSGDCRQNMHGWQAVGNQIIVYVSLVKYLSCEHLTDRNGQWLYMVIFLHTRTISCHAVLKLVKFESLFYDKDCSCNTEWDNEENLEVFHSYWHDYNKKKTVISFSPVPIFILLLCDGIYSFLNLEFWDVTNSLCRSCQKNAPWSCWRVRAST